MTIFDNPTVSSDVSITNLKMLNCCGMVMRPRKPEVEMRSPSSIDGHQYYLKGRCPVCDERRPTLVKVDQ